MSPFHCKNPYRVGDGWNGPVHDPPMNGFWRGGVSLGIIGACSVGWGCVSPERDPVSWRDKELRVVQIVSSNAPVPIPEGVVITFRWAADGKVSGKAPVNRYFGTLEESKAGQILWRGGVASTRMGGPPGLMSLEATYLKVLGSVSRSTRREAALVLATPDGGSVVELVP